MHTERPKLLDLFSGAGGAARGYQLAGFHVTGVDIRPQPRYVGDAFVLGDALAYLAAHWFEYDAIHASPPCQGYSRMLCATGSTSKPKLIGETRHALRQTGLPYVIENVEMAKSDMRDWVLLCGTAFGLRVRRHRLFELSPFQLILVPPCHCKNGVRDGVLIGHARMRSPGPESLEPAAFPYRRVRGALGPGILTLQRRIRRSD